MQYDLEERTAKFGEAVISFTKTLSFNVITKPLINQIVRSATSIGANYAEANHACSKKDFQNKISIATAVPEKKSQCQTLWKEAHELTRILAAIRKSSLKKAV